MSAAAVLPFQKPTTLYEITDHLEALFNTVDLIEDAEERAGAEAEVDAYLALQILKVDSIARYIAHCEAQAAFATEEIKRLQSRRRSYEARVERIEASVLRVIESTGKASIEGRFHTFITRKCPASVDVLDQSIVPQTYITLKVEESVDKAAAKAAMKAGEEIPGLRLITDRKTVVRK